MHHTDRVVAVQPASLVGDTWATEVIPRLPAALAAQARMLKAIQRVCGVATPTDLLRAVLAYGVSSPVASRPPSGSAKTSHMR